MTFLVLSAALASQPTEAVSIDAAYARCFAAGGVPCGVEEASELALRLELHGMLEDDMDSLARSLSLYEDMMLSLDDEDALAAVRLSAAGVALRMGKDFEARTWLKQVAMFRPPRYRAEAQARLEEMS
ncbi:MAG: hypothetical protein GY913_24110 [Proteobacteria bacterium]|nr:hypothetical protein [Pseudomonadota bacterium]MCP4919999.1 hypothetical protein [Pseudomonadota bacterium]